MHKPCLILLGGAPGVGKSTVANLLRQHLAPSVWLDGDDLWRMHPFAVTPRSKEMVLRHIRWLLTSFLSEPFDYVLFSWVMHEPGIAQQILRVLDPAGHILLHVTLACSEQTLLKRISGDSAERDPALCLDRLRSVRQNYPGAVDTDALDPEQTAKLILGMISNLSRNAW